MYVVCASATGPVISFPQRIQQVRLQSPLALGQTWIFGFGNTVIVMVILWRWAGVPATSFTPVRFLSQIRNGRSNKGWIMQRISLKRRPPCRSFALLPKQSD